MGQVSWVRQLSLAVLLFVLGSVAYWVEFKQKPQKEAQEELSKKMFVVKDVQVQAMKMLDGDRSFEFSCLDIASKLCKPGDNSMWELTKPVKMKADESTVNGLLSAINNLVPTEVISLKEETPEKRAALIKDYGLDPAARAGNATRKIFVQTQAGTTTAYLGLTHPIGDGIFSILEKNGSLDDTKVYLVPSYYKAHFEHDLTHWRNKKLLTLSAHEIEGFVLEGKKAGKIEASRKDGQWTLKSGTEEFAGDIENIDSLLSGAAYLTATKFPSDNKDDAKAKTALKGYQNLLTLTLRKERGTAAEAPAPVILKLFGKPAPAKDNAKAPQKSKPSKSPEPEYKTFATVSNLDPLFELDAGAQNRLEKTLKDLRLAKLITSMERFTAKSLTFSGKPVGSEPVTLTQKDGKWALSKDKSDADAEKVQSLLEKLSGNRIKDFMTSAPEGEKDGLEFTLADEKDAAKRRFLFWKNGGKLYAKDLNSKRKEALLIDGSVQDGLPWEPGFFKPKAK